MNQEFQNKDQENDKRNKHDNDKLLETGKKYIENILNEALSTFERMMDQHYPNKKITDFLDRLSNPEINDLELTNAQKFKIIANNKIQEGDEETAASLIHLADSVERAVKFLGDLSFNNSDHNLNDHDEN
jgi:hypothetical protein